MSTVYTLKDVLEHNDGRSCWIVIDNKVYNITEFLDEHPGGEEVLLELAGQDGTEQFEDVGHSEDARELLKKYYIGDLHEDDVSKQSDKKSSGSGVSVSKDGDKETGSSNFLTVVALMVIGVAVGFMVYLQTNKS